MKQLSCLCLALALSSCGPSSNSAPDTETTKTTTITTTTPPAPPTPAVPVVPATTLTQANLDRVQNDMSAAEVEAIFGPPSSSQTQPIPIVGGTQTTYTYQDGTSAVTIVFKNDQVKEKSGTFGP
jgi:hypothetical protein